MNLLQYINKFTPEDTNKLAMATGLFCSSGLATLNVLSVLFKEHLVKEGKFQTKRKHITLSCFKVDELSQGTRVIGDTDERK